MSVTHLAGNAVTIDGRIVQRCLICGYKLNDSKGAAMQTNPDGTPPVFPVWVAGAMVRVDGNCHALVIQTNGPDLTGGEIPDDCCIVLVEE